MRTFIAAELPEEIKEYLYNLEKQLKTKLPSKINWVHKKNLHITLKFLGEVKESDVEIIKNNLTNIKIKSFDLSLAKIGTFPQYGTPKVIWIGLTPEKPLIELQQKVDEETIKYFSSAKFEAHLTLGRIRQIKEREAFKKILEQIEINKLNFKVDSFTLFESILTKDGAKYKAIEKYSLI